MNTGLFGMKDNFAPLAGSSFAGDDLVLPFDKNVVKDSPDIADATHLDTDEQQSLYSYYQSYLGAGTTGPGGYDQTTTNDAGYQPGNGSDTSGPNTDNAMTRSEEHLRVGTEQVPISREEVRVEREPITDANRGQALSGGEITEEEHEVVLHAERPVVTTEAVPVERVRLGTESVTEQQTVTGEVRKEQVELDDTTTRDR